IFCNYSLYLISSLFLFLSPFSNLNADSVKVVILPVEDKSRILGEAKKEEIYDSLSKNLNRTSEFKVIDRGQTKVLLKEMKIEQQGLTKTNEIKLLESSDAILVPTVNTESIKGKILLTLKLNLISRDSTSSQGSGVLEESSFSEGIDLSVKDLLHTMYPNRYEKPNDSLLTSSKSSALLRSAVLPGWGQYYKNQKWKSAFIFFGVLGAGGFLYNSYNSYHSSENKFHSLNTQNTLLTASAQHTQLSALWFYTQSQSVRSDIRSSGNQITSVSALLLGLYIYNLADAYFSAQAKPTAWNELNEKRNGFQIGFSREQNLYQTGQSFQMSYQFQF
ncbi:MAG TPA: DUF5683 domain-containing protein, partial [Leptospiraceae bacterium]|nr:DUF5683 domain-containing protein [Leptospiraceae bacterium]